MTDWHKVESSMLAAIRWIEGETKDGVTFGRVEVTWKNGTKGAYLDVNRRTWDDFLQAESVGKFVNTVLKPNFRYERLEDEDEDEGEAGYTPAY